ncbi:MAG: hypothetical protein WAT71_07665 [Ignavibacteria bacterium]
MRWCIESRNHIEKEGDLETYSCVKVCILSNWEEPPVVEFKVSPFLTTEEIASNINLQNIPNQVIETGILSIERRWVSSNLTKYELLDALAYIYGFLTNLIKDAHDVLGVESSFDYTQPIDGRLPIMASFIENRIIFIKLATNEHIEGQKTLNETTKGDIEIARKRYGITESTNIPDPNNSTLLSIAEFYFELAKKILVKDGHHIQIVILILPDGNQIRMSLDLKDRSEKYMGFRQVAQEVVNTGAIRLISISEAWMAKPDPTKPFQTATDSPDRIEIIKLDAISFEGESFSITAPFIHEGNKIVIEDSIIDEKVKILYLDPIRRIWEKQKRI